MRKSLIIIIFIILFAFNAYAIAEKTNVAIILHATDKFSFIQSLIKDSIKKAENQITSKLRIKTYDLKKQDIPILIHATEEIINQNNQIIIHGILPYEFSNYQSLINFYMRH